MTADRTVAQAGVSKLERTSAGPEQEIRRYGNQEWAQEVLALARRWFIQVLRDKLNLIFSVIQPAIWLLFFGSAVARAIDPEVIGTRNYLGFVLPGIIAFTVVTNSVSGAMPLLWDKEGGYLDKLLSMPIARSSVIVSRFVFQLALVIAQVVLVLLVGLLMGVRVAAGIPGVLVILLADALLIMALTAASAALVYRVPTHGTFFAVTGFLMLPMLFMSSAFVPLTAMPSWMAAVARANPLTYAIEAMRILILDGWERGLVAALAVLGVFAGGLLALGTYEFRRHTGERVN
ncbi:MAG: ABC transporter permease [Actinomycetota bacterium]|nr:ABC transporter permease [Actinomycetota bacterium]